MSKIQVLESYRQQVINARNKCYAVPTAENNKALFMAIRNYKAIEKSLIIRKESK